MVAQTLTKMGNEIFLVRNVLDPALCQQVIATAESCEFETAAILLNQTDRSVRSNDYLALGGKETTRQSLNQLLLQRIVIVQQLLYQEYGIKFPYAEPCAILRYREGHFYKRHVDNLLLASRFQELEQGIPTRDISIVGYLNDNFDGGETYFDRQDVTVKPEAGAIVAFPSYYTHPHASLPIRNGQKYAFTSWLFY